MEQKIEFNHGKFLLTIVLQLFFCIITFSTVFSNSSANLDNLKTNPANLIFIGLGSIFAIHAILTTFQYIARICAGYGCFTISPDGLKNVYYDTGDLYPPLSPSTRLLPWEAIDNIEIASLPAGRGGHRAVIFIRVDPSKLPDDTPSGFRSIIKERTTALIGGEDLGVGFYLDTHAVDQSPFVLLSLLKSAMMQYK